MIIKPMLADTLEDVSDLKFPVACTPKLDGIRCLRVNSSTLSRKFKLIPNLHIQASMANLIDGLDGELMVPNTTFNNISSAVMSSDGEPNFEYWVFDYVDKGGLAVPYMKRMENLGKLALPPFCKKVLPWIANNIDELLNFEQMVLAQGYEGVMTRSLASPYKCGRSTVREGYLLKLKRFKDSEAEVLDFEERMHNANKATLDAFGRTKRSAHKANLIPDDTLGAFVVRDVTTGLEFRVATGLDDAFRKKIWGDRERYRGKLIKYKYQEAGMKDLPRFPVFLGFRDPNDMS